jgi:hypothetical protein
MQDGGIRRGIEAQIKEGREIGHIAFSFGAPLTIFSTRNRIS